MGSQAPRLFDSVKLKNRKPQAVSSGRAAILRDARGQARVLLRMRFECVARQSRNKQNPRPEERSAQRAASRRTAKHSRPLRMRFEIVEAQPPTAALILRNEGAQRRVSRRMAAQRRRCGMVTYARHVIYVSATRWGAAQSAQSLSGVIGCPNRRSINGRKWVHIRV